MPLKEYFGRPLLAKLLVTNSMSKEEFDMWLVEAESEPERYQSISCFDHVALAAIKDALRSLSEYLRGKE